MTATGGSEMGKPRCDGYRGIWFTLGQITDGRYGDKYSGGLGTYTAKHVPMAVYSSQVDRTYFTYGGTRAAGERHLLNMVSYYDHPRHQVPRPVVVHDKDGVDDPHDNATLCLAGDGHLWVFVSGRSRRRPGFKYRSLRPHDIDDFELIATQEMTYAQPWSLPGGDFINLYTRYTDGRELYWETSTDGRRWSAERKLAGFGGHYQMSACLGVRVATAFNWHPGGTPDTRTNLYYLETRDAGQSWTTVSGEPVATPLNQPDNAALVMDSASMDELLYLNHVTFDSKDNPVLQYVTSRGYAPGPAGDPRTWRVTRWNGEEWVTHDITTSDHNYDTGSLLIDGGEWIMIGPTEPGPHPYHTGGEMALWRSVDEGETWARARQLTHDSKLNHMYARAPVGGREPFRVFWADGDPSDFSVSRLYFADGGGRVWQLPYDMEGDAADPERL